MADQIEKFEVRNRWTGEVQFTAEISCAPDAPPAVKLGLAVRWGFEKRANLYGARLYGARLVGANLDGANLVGANLDGANLDGANLVGANLVGARLVGARLVGANLDGANLVGARLDGANLDGANLVGARLDGANLDGANLVGARLDGARLDGANLDGAKIKSVLAIVTRIHGGYVFHAFDTDQGVRIVAGCRNFSPAEYRDHVACEYPGTKKAAETLAIIAYVEARAVAMGVAA